MIDLPLTDIHGKLERPKAQHHPRNKDRFKVQELDRALIQAQDSYRVIIEVVRFNVLSGELLISVQLRLQPMARFAT